MAVHDAVVPRFRADSGLDIIGWIMLGTAALLILITLLDRTLRRTAV